MKIWLQWLVTRQYLQRSWYVLKAAVRDSRMSYACTADYTHNHTHTEQAIYVVAMAR